MMVLIIPWVMNKIQSFYNFFFGLKRRLLEFKVLGTIVEVIEKEIVLVLEPITILKVCEG
jgi:hypothetical protein